MMRCPQCNRETTVNTGDACLGCELPIDKWREYSIAKNLSLFGNPIVCAGGAGGGGRGADVAGGGRSGIVIARWGDYAPTEYTIVQGDPVDSISPAPPVLTSAMLEEVRAQMERSIDQRAEQLAEAVYNRRMEQALEVFVQPRLRRTATEILNSQ